MDGTTCRAPPGRQRESDLLCLAVVLFAFANLAAWLGLGSAAAGAVSIASVLFVSFTTLTIARYAHALLRNR